MRTDGYTLIEVLAVVALTALVTAAVSPGLVALATSDPLTEAIHQVREHDRMARQQAVGVGGSWRITEGRLVAEIAGWPAPMIDLPPDCQVVIQGGNAEQTLERVVFDRSGCSGDVQVIVTHGQQQRRYRLHGLTGAWEAIAERRP
jgi:prepilin-type N-terminal cleavage/methylation domain-containing protein